MLCSHTGPNVSFLSSRGVLLFPSSGEGPLLGVAHPQGSFPVHDEGCRVSFLPLFFMRTILSLVCVGIEVVYNSILPPLSYLPANECVVGGGKRKQKNGVLTFLIFRSLISTEV